MGRRRTEAAAFQYSCGRMLYGQKQAKRAYGLARAEHTSARICNGKGPRRCKGNFQHGALAVANSRASSAIHSIVGTCASIPSAEPFLGKPAETLLFRHPKWGSKKLRAFGKAFLRTPLRWSPTAPLLWRRRSYVLLGRFSKHTFLSPAGFPGLRIINAAS